MLNEFKDIIPSIVETAIESTPVKKVSETGSGARLILSFAGMIICFLFLIYIMSRWYPYKAYRALEIKLEKEERYADSLRTVRYESQHTEAVVMARQMFEEWKQNYIITQNGHSTITIKAK